jgi:hypothetical protein
MLRQAHWRLSIVDTHTHVTITVMPDTVSLRMTLLTFDVAVDDVLTVQVLETGEDLLHVSSHDGLVEGTKLVENVTK